MKPKISKNIITIEKIWLTQEEASVYIGMGGADFWLEARNNGEIPFHRIGNRILYLKSDIDNYVRKHRASVI